MLGKVEALVAEAAVGFAAPGLGEAALFEVADDALAGAAGMNAAGGCDESENVADVAGHMGVDVGGEGGAGFGERAEGAADFDAACVRPFDGGSDVALCLLQLLG